MKNVFFLLHSCEKSSNVAPEDLLHRATFYFEGDFL